MDTDTITETTIPIGDVRLTADLVTPTAAVGVVLFAHGSGSSRRSPRNVAVAQVLQRNALATVLVDLLTPEEERVDEQTAELRFDIGLLAGRLVGAVDWLRTKPQTAALPIGLFGASTGAAAALVAAAERPDQVPAVVSRGGRPDLAGPDLSRVRAATLLLVGGRDEEVIQLNQQARDALGGPVELRIIPDATHLFPEPGALEQVADQAAGWFADRLPGFGAALAGRSSACLFLGPIGGLPLLCTPDQWVTPDMHIGIIGAGHVGGTLARRLAQAGHEIAIANSSGPKTLTDLVGELGHRAHAVSPSEAARFGDLVILAVPFGRYDELPTTELRGKPVIDVGNYDPERDGNYPELDQDKTTSSELVQDHLRGAHVVKAFNTLHAPQMRDLARQSSAQERYGIPMSGDDPQAKRAVADLVEQLGFQPVDVGDLASGGRKQQPGGLTYEADLTADELVEALREG